VTECPCCMLAVHMVFLRLTQRLLNHSG
jgi:hypothetical protein